MDDLFKYQGEVDELPARYGVKLGIYKDRKFAEQPVLFDVVPRTIPWKSGLTRFSRNPDSFIVNSSQGAAPRTHACFLQR